MNVFGMRLIVACLILSLLLFTLLVHTSPAVGGIKKSYEWTFWWCINLCPDDIDYNLTNASIAFQYVKDLGCKFIRSDICWLDFEPENGTWNYSMIEWYRDYISLAENMGIGIIAAVHRAPQWALDLYNNNTTIFFKKWMEFCGKVASELGDKIYYYQLWNEANHIFDPIKSEDDWKLFYWGRKGIKGNDSHFKIIVNVMCNVQYWDDALQEWCSKVGNCIDVIGIDHYPGTWTASGYDDWYPLDRLIQLISDPESPCYGKEGAITETGYSTYNELLHNENMQCDFVNTSLPIIREKVASYNQNHTNKIIFASWYELYDTVNPAWGNASQWCEIESHFGILRENGSKKLAYPYLKEQISLYPDNTHWINVLAKYADGSAVSDANVTLTNLRTGEVLKNTTNSSGWAIFDLQKFPSGFNIGDVIEIKGEKNSSVCVTNITVNNSTIQSATLFFNYVSDIPLNLYNSIIWGCSSIIYFVIFRRHSK